jgi:hypothetical protein
MRRREKASIAIVEVSVECGHDCLLIPVVAIVVPNY